jgi:uncharacterized protein YjhX (UPF0386 family)
MKKNVTEQKKITTLKSLTRHGETLHSCPLVFFFLKKILNIF